MKIRSSLAHLVILLILSILLTACEDRFATPSPEAQESAQENRPEIVTEQIPSTEPIELSAPPPSKSAIPSAVPSPEVVLELEPLNLNPVVGDLRSQQMLDFLNKEFDKGKFIGTVFVAQNGDILINEGFGQANIQMGIPNDPQTQFRIGSLTKQFTAAAILKLQEEGLLNVNEPVSQYLPDYPRGDEITIHQLLTHTAGIPNYERRSDLPEVVQSPIALDALIASFADQPLQFPPGQRYEYSSSGYVVLTKIIELVSGQPYDQYLNEQFFIPLQMTGTGYDYLASDLPNPAVGYHLTPGGSRPAILTDSSWPTGAGALYSTAGDLYRWDRALYTDDVLSADSLQAFFTPYADTGQGPYYGYGWDIGTTAGRPSIAHGGGIFGFASFMTRFPEDDAVIIVLSNGIQMPPRIIADGLAPIIFNES